MNVYDFDNTIFSPDSSMSFLLFLARRYPRAVLRVLPDAGREWLSYRKEGKRNAKYLKETLFSVLSYLWNVDEEVEAFWRTRSEKLAAWYLQQRREDDVIISASPEFLLRPMAERWGFLLLGTRMNSDTGTICGENCHDEEKVRRFRELFPHDRIDNFYSDSLSDTPLARLAEHAWLVQGTELFPWPEESLK